MTLREITLHLAGLLDRKRESYGDSVSTSEIALSLLYPHGVPPEAFGDVLLIARVWDKLQRIATGKPEPDGESPWLDIAGYGVCGVYHHQQNAQLKEMFRAWEDSANGPAAPPQSAEPAASAAPPTSGPTRSNASAPPATHATPPSSPLPDALSQLQAAAHVQSVCEEHGPGICPACNYAASRGRVLTGNHEFPWGPCTDPFHDARGHR